MASIPSPSQAAPLTPSAPWLAKPGGYTQVMHVSFVIPTYRRPDALRLTLAALLELDFPASDYEVIVVDDGSDDSTADVVATFAQGESRVIYLTQPSSGAATARNRGASEASGELLIFLDDDIVVAPDHVRAHLAARSAHGDCLVNGCGSISPTVSAVLAQTPFGRFRVALDRSVQAALPKVPLDDGRMRPRHISAQNLSISKSLFHDLGGFDESFPYAGREDSDFGLRAIAAGCSLVYDPGIKYAHNDQHASLDQMGGRLQRDAVTFVFLVTRHPDVHASDALLLENAPISRFDPWRLRVKKSLKALCASGPGLLAVRGVVALCERLPVSTRLLTRLYSIALGAYIFRGIQEGLRALPEARQIALDAMRARCGDAETKYWKLRSP